MPTDTRIILQGCDEATEVTLSLAVWELNAIKRVAEALNLASVSDCHPRIEVIA